MAEETTGRKFAKKDDDVLPAIYYHSMDVYRAMLEEASAVVDAESNIIVYEGFLTRLVTQKLRLSVPYYGSVRSLLIDMGCIRQLKRGGGTAPSQYEMITEPTEEKFREVYKPDQERPETKIGKANARIDNLEKLCSQLQTRVSSIEEFLAEQYGTETVVD